ncbi:MAG: ParB N-terminal domain-containing protein [Holophaga sp.]|nr:ParB N-terminal domain-containing protein [Holophaga sp.]
MELEFQQIDLRNDHLRKRNLALERQLLASLDGVGQRVPVVVVAEQDHFILLDGFKRLRALKRLRRDTVVATLWDLNEAEGLLLERLMRASQPEGPLEQGWLLRDLQDRFRMSMDELARRFDRTTSWVSRRLALVHDLPEPVQDQVRAGRIAPHTAMKVLVPLARANKRDCLRFLEALLKAEFSTRQAEALQAGWLKGNPEVRERILGDPGLFLRSQQAAQTVEDLKGPYALWLDDLGALAAVARRAGRHLRDGAAQGISTPQGEEANAAIRQARQDCHALFDRSEKELTHA